jgi:site-specific DNA recombinase
MSAPIWRVIIYARLSKNRYGLSTNTAIQVGECRDEAESEARLRGRTLDLVKVFEEDDVGASKFSKKPRPLWEQMLDFVRANRVDTVMSTEPERLCRKPADGDVLITLAETTDLAELFFTSEESLDLATPNGIFKARQYFALAERESNKNSQRIRRKKAERAALGLPNGGQRAFGYSADGMEIEPGEKALLLQAGQRFVDGWSYTDLARWLNDSGTRTTEGNVWRAINVNLMLTRKRYAGIRVHNGAEYPAQWPAIFDRETWGKIQLTNQLRRERGASSTPAKPRYLLTGLLVCGRCGSRLGGTVIKERHGPKRYYRCKVRKELGEGCNGVVRSADALDTYLTDMALARLESDEMAGLLRQEEPDDGRLADLLGQRKVIVERLDNLDDMFMAGKIDTEARLNRMRGRGAANLAAIDQEIDRLNRNRRSLGRLPVGWAARETWEANSDSWRREILSLLIDHITVNPAKRKPLYADTGFRLDTQAIEIAWRI